MVNSGLIDKYNPYLEEGELKQSDELKIFIDQLEILKLHSYENKLVEKLIQD